MITSSLKKGADGLLRNALTTIPTIIVIAIVLTLFHGLLVVREHAQETLQTLQQKFSITVYLKDSSDPFEISKLITDLEARPDILPPVIYTSKEDAWNMISKTFSLDNELLKKYQFSLPASMTITPKSIDNAADIEIYLNSRASSLLRDSQVSASKQKNIANQMINFVSNIRQTTLRTTFLFLMLFLIGGALLIGNAIHLGLTVRHREIGIMKLMGASHMQIVLPFIIEGILMGAIAFLLHFAMTFALPIHLANPAAEKSALLSELTVTLLWSGLISFVTSYFVLKRTSIFS